MSWFDRWVVWCLPLAPKVLVRRFARRYVAGETLEDMLQTVRALNQQGMEATIDVLGEFVRSPEEARQAAQQYHDILEAVAREGLRANISVKLTQMGLLLDTALCEEILDNLVRAAAANQNFVRIDMEDSTCTDATIALYLKLRARYPNVGIVLQAYLRRTLADARQIIQTVGAQGAGGGQANFRLCKGIYVEPRQVALKTHPLIHQNYAWVLEEMFRAGAYVGIATHHEELVWTALRLIDRAGLTPEQYEFQMLLGVDPELRRIILQEGHRLRVYVPFGSQWYAYCMRRLKENPAIARHILKNLWVSWRERGGLS